MRKIEYILLIDDDEATNFYNKIIITDCDVADIVKIATNGQEALNILQEDLEAGRKPNIIFLDINMPVMNGFEFLDAYEKLPDAVKSEVLIVMLTTSLHQKDKDRASLYKTISEFRNKPISAKMLKEIWETYFPDHK